MDIQIPTRRLTRARLGPRRAGRCTASLLLGGLAMLCAPAATSAQDRGPDLRVVDVRAARQFAVLPAEANEPEGITADPRTGEVFVGTAEIGGDNFLLRLDRRGRVVAQLPLGPLPLLGLAFNPRDSMVYAAVPGILAGQASRVARIAADFDAMSAFEDVAVLPSLPGPLSRVGASLNGTQSTLTFNSNLSLPNGLAFRESDGALFVTDSFQSAVFRVEDPTLASNLCPDAPDCVAAVIQDALLASAGDPPIGSNGVAFNEDESTLFIANTGDDRILRLDMVGTDGLSVFVQGINGVDDLITGPGNTLIAAANRADQVVVIDAASGAVIAELGEFFGTRPDGTAIGLSAPASVVRLGRFLFATNPGRPAAADEQPQLDSIARIRLPRRLLEGLARNEHDHRRASEMGGED